jgi:transcriptional regulator with XRE-family HTH domain
MKVLEISGKEISADLGIDETTVSKWRNNQRKLSYKNKYIHRIAEILLSSEVEHKRRIIANILKNYRKDLNQHSQQQQIDSLCLWMTEDQIDAPAQNNPNREFSPRNGYNTPVSIFLGENGIDEAIEYFMKYLLRAAPGKTMYLIDFSGINWASGDEEPDFQVRVKSCMELFQPFLEYGHKFVIVDCNTDIYRPYKAIFRWIKLYLTEGVEVWAHPQMSLDKNYYTTFVVRNELALQCIANADYPNDRHCMLFRNKESVDFYANGAEAIIRKSKKLIETKESNEVLELVIAMERYLKPNHTVYMFNPSPTLQDAGEGLLKTILMENNVDGEKIEKIILIRKKYAKMQKLCKYISIYNLDMFARLSEGEFVIDGDLSKICEKEIKISYACWTRLIQTIQRATEADNHPIVFSSFSYANIVPSNLSIFVQEDTLVCVWDLQKFKKSMYCTNPDVVAGFYRYLDEMWHILPGVCKDFEWRNKQLDRLIKPIEF